jgi:signal transduction histidine kinase
MADTPKKAKAKMKGLPPSLLFMVKDNGIGIAEHDLDRIFERFYKSDRNHTRQQKGTGLGLAIAKHLIEAHNGRLWAQSNPEKGSTFYFTLNTF